MPWLYLPFILFLLFLLYLLIFRYKAPFVPVFKKDLPRLASLLKLEAGKTFYELGCGNGRVLFYLAKKNPQVNFIGVEISFIMYLICQLRKIFGGYKNVRIKLNDFMRMDFAKADYLYFFLLAEGLEKFYQKLKNELKPGAQVMTFCFEIKAWKDRLLKENKPQPKDISIYIYQL